MSPPAGATYGKKSSKRSIPPVASTSTPSISAESGSKSSGGNSRPRKRRRLSVEVTIVSSNPNGIKDEPRPSSSRGRSHKPESQPAPATPHNPLTRDLSQIFDQAALSFPAPSTPTKRTSRMLGRSHTDSTINSARSISPLSTHHNPVRPTSSLGAISPSSTSSVKATPSASTPTLVPPHDASYANIATSAAVAPSSTPGPSTLRTYAGASRSFLVSMPLNGGLDSLNGDGDEARPSYATLRHDYGIDNSDDPEMNMSPVASTRSSASVTPLSLTPVKKSISHNNGHSSARKPRSYHLPEPRRQPEPEPLPSGMMNPLKSITELRSKGENRRFLDDMGYLFEGLDPSGPIGLRRATALEITTKLCDPVFAKKANAADFYARTWQAMSRSGAGRGEDKACFFLLNWDLASRFAAGEDALVPSLFSLLNSIQHNFNESQSSSNNEDLLALIDANAPEAELRRSKVSKTSKGTLSKKDKSTIVNIRDTVRFKSRLFPSDTPLSTNLLVTHALCALPSGTLPAARAAILPVVCHNMLAPLCSKQANPPSSDVTLCLLELHNTLRLLDAFFLGQWADSDQPLDAQKTRLGDLDVSNSMDHENDKTDTSESVRQAALDSGLAADLLAFEVYLEMPSTRVGDAKLGLCRSSLNVILLTFLLYYRFCVCDVVLHRTAETALRLLVTLTHADSSWCEAVLAHPFTIGFIVREIARGERSMRDADRLEKRRNIEPAKKEADDVGDWQFARVVGGVDINNENGPEPLDRLCLALGLLTNLTQSIRTITDVLRKTRLSPSSGGAFDVLIDLYVYLLSDTAQSAGKVEPALLADKPLIAVSDKSVSSAAFLCGHLAVLLGLLMRGSAASQEEILSILLRKTGTSRLVCVTTLAKHAQVFADFFDKAGAADNGGVGSFGQSTDIVDTISYIQRLR
ncbi:hypothetical protein FISHEDRAFT_76984 [Fistulina hepatica ATCC 64428]|uniref:Wings apart-like protein C-terminal domain-containing protein n=1 Tax=Fistulina hepatica ATCC 64428 TaxID=1128425 RepID=A0A0D7A2C7_9AGAR|nr:hypothetical protein FISHEDRAFT_76984 [Fistulina hepatica ATCC 64428]